MTKESGKTTKAPTPAERDEKVKIDLDPEEALRRLLGTKPKRNGTTPTAR